MNLFKDYIPEAFPDGDDLILDAEVLMIDTKTGQPLPFGSLGIHKVRIVLEVHTDPSDPFLQHF